MAQTKSHSEVGRLQIITGCNSVGKSRANAIYHTLVNAGGGGMDGWFVGWQVYMYRRKYCNLPEAASRRDILEMGHTQLCSE